MREMTNATTSPEPDAGFLAATEHVPGEIGDDKKDQFAGMQPEVELPGEQKATAWTVGIITDLFHGCFSVLVFSRLVVPLGGEHWNIPRDKCEQLATACLPLFERHIPFGSDLAWLPDFMMYLTVLGVAKEVLGPAIKMEIYLYQLLQAQKKNQGAGKRPGGPQGFSGFGTGNTSTASTQTETSPASSESSASATAEKPTDNGFRANFASAD